MSNLKTIVLSKFSFRRGSQVRVTHLENLIEKSVNILCITNFSEQMKKQHKLKCLPESHHCYYREIVKTIKNRIICE